MTTEQKFRYTLGKKTGGQLYYSDNKELVKQWVIYDNFIVLSVRRIKNVK